MLHVSGRQRTVCHNNRVMPITTTTSTVSPCVTMFYSNYRCRDILTFYVMLTVVLALRTWFTNDPLSAEAKVSTPACWIMGGITGSCHRV